MRNRGIKLILVQIIVFGSLNTCLNANTVGDLTSSSDTITYLFSNDTLRQSITIIHLKEQIQYFYNIKNINRGLALDLKGFATKVESENMQFEEIRDSLYLVDVYQDKKGDCWVTITLDNENEELLTIDETTQCQEYRNHLIPVNSLDILQRENRKKQ
jgi:hypothetical protein